MLEKNKKGMEFKMKPKISVILATYNERENINDLISEIGYYISKYTREPIEFILVDDDSPDKTWEVVQECFKEDRRVKVIRRTEERGLASAIRRGIQESRGDIIVWLDCDFSMPPYKIPELINKIHQGYDICVGSKFIKGGKDVRGPVDAWTAVVLSGIMSNFIRYMLGFAFKDYTSGFVAARREVFNEIRFGGDYGEYFIEFIYKARKKEYKIIEIPYYCIPRRFGVSKTGTNFREYFKKGWKYVWLTVRLKFNLEETDKNRK